MTSSGPGTSAPPRHPAPLTWALLAGGLLAAGVFLAGVLLDPGRLMPLFDLAAYRTGGQRVLDGVSLYDTPLVGNVRGVFEFVYPPFAGLLFVPLAGLHGAAFTAAAVLLGVGLAGYLVWLAVRATGFAHPAWAAVGLTGLLIWCDAVYETITFGQVNLLVAVLVLADLSRPEGARGRGVLLGVAAGIKLTPLFFVAHLLLTRRWKDAVAALGGFAGTVLVGALLLPRDSWEYWSGAFADPARVGVPQHPGNQSLRGLIATWLGDGAGQKALWLVLAVVIALVGLWQARELSRAGREVPAVVLCGVVATVVSPFSWVHHWVWWAPVLVLLLDRAVTRGGVPGWLPLALAAVIGAHGFFVVARAVDVGRPFYGHAYVWLTVGLLAGLTARSVVPLRRFSERARPRTGAGTDSGRD
jgi:alpha-1,2-mannosyltransferase